MGVACNLKTQFRFGAWPGFLRLADSEGLRSERRLPAFSADFRHKFTSRSDACDNELRPLQHFSARASASPFAHGPTTHRCDWRGGGGGRRGAAAPINFLSLLNNGRQYQIWLYEQLSIRIVGTIRVRLSRVGAHLLI